MSIIPTNRKQERSTDFNMISLRLASPDRIREWSYGEVTKPETINYRTGRSERSGLFDERIFGPERDYECYCGKYRRIRYKDIICEKCGVEVTRSIVRRERMGHIELASPVAHIWFLRGIPSRIALILDLPVVEVEKVVYFAGYIVTRVDEEEKTKILKELDNEYKNRVKNLTDDASREKLKESFLEAKRQVENLAPWKVVDEITYHRLSLKYGTAFEAGIGAEAITTIFKDINLDQMLVLAQTNLEKASAVDRPKARKRYNLLKSMKRSGVRPEWMFLSVIPVIPPDLRPMVALDGGRHATSDVNDLYRRVINRNNRLKKLQELSAPEVILRNEKRILQEAVDALLDNSIRRLGSSGGALNQAQRRPLKSLADSLKGKQGRFRQNLLGKRVDYSGRSVIVVGPELALSECGLPKQMALELFRPFVIAKILEQELAFNIRGAGRLIDDEVPEVWAILEDVIKDKFILLNRAPTLHRLGVQAFRPILIEGNAIQVHPFVCSAFNADFDGDQMAVHVPLSAEAQREARELMSSAKNLLKPGSGDPIISPKLDVVLGCYWVTKIIPGELGEGSMFSDPNNAIMAYDYGHVSLRAKIKLHGGTKEKYQVFGDELLETSVGRLLFNSILPADFPYINQEVTVKDLGKIVENLMAKYNHDLVPDILDKVKSFGFKYATKSGTSWGLLDVVVPEGKKQLVADARAEVLSIEDKYQDGLLSDDEKYRMTIEVWQGVIGKVEKILPSAMDPLGSVMSLIQSGARGSLRQVGQMAGMKGLIQNTTGRLIDFPIVPSYSEGLSPLEYFITTHGSRKGLADTALNTAKAGYLTRKLVDVSQDVVIWEVDCGDKDGKAMMRSVILSDFDAGLERAIRGRILAADVVGADGKVMFKKGHLLTKEEAETIDKAEIDGVRVRSPLTCKSLRGVCQQCYGTDLGRGGLVKIGEAVGIVAAQAIGEPGTQLTMRTKHAGGVDTGGDIVGGLPRVEEIFERRIPKSTAVVSEVNGEVIEIKSDHREQKITVLADLEGRSAGKNGNSIEYTAPAFRNLFVKKGDKVTKGMLLTDGSVDPAVLFKLAGKEKTEDYVIREINKIYDPQGASVARKHVELILRQMMSRRKIKDPGDTKFFLNEIVEFTELVEENQLIKTSGGQEATAESIIVGISEVALTTASFLSAVSFQHSTRILIDAAVSGGIDRLRGLKENVIIGRLIPAGTGLSQDYKRSAEIEEVPMVE